MNHTDLKLDFVWRNGDLDMEYGHKVSFHLDENSYPIMVNRGEHPLKVKVRVFLNSGL